MNSVESNLLTVLSIFAGCLGILEAIEPKFTLPHRGCYLLGNTLHDLSSSEFKFSDLKPTLCTYFVYGYATIQDNELQITPKDEENLRMLNLVRSVNPTVNLFLALHEVDEKLSEQLVSSFVYLPNRTDFVSTVAEKLRIWQMDGFLLDIQSPSYAAANVLSLIIKDLHAKFSEESKSNRPRLALAIHVGQSAKDARIDPSVLGSLPDIVEVHTFNYYTPEMEPSKTGHNAPLYLTNIPGSHPRTIKLLSVENQLSATKKPTFDEVTTGQLSGEFSLNDWETAGVPKSKLVVTIPLYGHAWTLMKMHRFEAGAPARGAAAGFSHLGKEGNIQYHDVCQLVHQGNLTRVFDTDNMVPYAHDNDTIWVSYDDADSSKIKARWVLENGYAGVTFYDLSMEDFNGSCGKDSFSTLQAVDAIFSTAATVNFQEKRECDRKFCLSRGVGVYALGACGDSYCNCDYGGKSYKFRCGPGTIFDPLILACNYATAVKGCENLETPTTL